jgi:hypothetical protein
VLIAEKSQLRTDIHARRSRVAHEKHDPRLLRRKQAMPHLWIQHSAPSAPTADIEDESCRWLAAPLVGDALHLPLRHEGHGAVAPTGTVAPPDRPASVLRVSGGDGEYWLLAGSESVRVNGLPLLAGIRVLRDRDEIRVDGDPPVYFSTEKLARVECFPGAARPTFCARCKVEIEVGSAAVQCPNCGVWCHETEELNCWSYPEARTCPLCDHRNSLDATYRWTPASL